MAKITGPLMSISATGCIGKKITFCGSSGGQRAIFFKPPSGTGTPTRKALYKAGCAAWRALDTPTKAAWKAQASSLLLTGFNLWMKTYLIAPPAAGTIWDSNATNWDANATNWDV